METKAAIVSTIKQPGATLSFFLRYHLRIGFDHIFLFFDDPLDPDLPLAENIPGVTILKNDDSLRREWEKTKSYKENSIHASFIDKEAMARQILNVEVAVPLALSMGIAWLLHIDYDELFFCKSHSIKNHFDQLTRKGINSMRYINHEAVPETLEVDNFFTEISLFKKNKMVFNPQQLSYFNRLASKDHFLYYWHGKSAGRVTEDLRPAHVHGFTFHEEQNTTDDPCILHYPVCGLTNLIKKYKILGVFDDKWFGTAKIDELIPFHVSARDIVNSGTPETIKRFYINKVMAKKDRVTMHLQNGIYFREQSISSL